MSKFSHQEAFNTAYLHLLKQGQNAKSPGSNYCAYLNDEGLKCAVGALIPDDKYDPDFEGLIASDYRICRAVGASTEEGGFLLNMQALLHDDHRDSPDFLKDFKKAAVRFADENHLNVPT